MRPDTIPDGSLVLLDTVALVYFLESHPVYGPIAEAEFKRVEAGSLNAVMSSLVFAELLVPLYRARQEKTAEALKQQLLGFRNLQVRNLTPEISATAARMRAQYGLRTPDALHAATGVAAGADGMLTNDKGLNRVNSELRVWLFEDLGD